MIKKENFDHYRYCLYSDKLHVYVLTKRKPDKKTYKG